MPRHTTIEEVKDLIEQYHAEWLLPHIYDIVHIFNQTDGTGRIENLIKNLKSPPFGHEEARRRKLFCHTARGYVHLLP